MNCLKSAKIAIATTLLTQLASISLPTAWQMMPSAQALPGQRPSQVLDWIKAHPVLRPKSNERLLVRKSDTASRRFEFQASVFIPGFAVMRGDPNRIRSEQIRFFDIVNGVTKSRLEESLRAIYGPEIMRDYATAKQVYAYPTTAMALRSQKRNASPILMALQGELRQGKKYAYWVELLQNNRGSANSGQITVFELDNLLKLEEELRKR
jgi:hypothetical protein